MSKVIWVLLFDFKVKAFEVQKIVFMLGHFWTLTFLTVSLIIYFLYRVYQFEKMKEVYISIVLIFELLKISFVSE